METVHIPGPTSVIIFFALLGPGRNPLGQGACPRAFGGIFWGQQWAKDHCATRMEKHLEPKKGAHCWKVTEHLQNLKRSEQSVRVFL